MLRNPSAGVIALLVLSLALAGCKGNEEEFKTQEKGKTVKAPEYHGHDYGPGPHEGKMADLGTDHSLVAEITFTDDPREIRVYILDHNTQKKAMPIEASSMTLELHSEEGDLPPVNLSADPQDGDGEGKASQFMVQGEAIPEAIKRLEDIEGHLEAKIGEETKVAEFGEHEDHDE